jgi:predicted nucleotidyltransferase
MIDESTIQSVVNTIVTRLSPRRVILFGSYARGQMGPDSDLDLFVEMDAPLPTRSRAMRIKQLFDPYPCPMDIVVYTPEEVAYWRQAAASLVASVLREGKVLYERSR